MEQPESINPNDVGQNGENKRWDQEAEEPAAGLDRRLASLKDAGIGKPIFIGEKGEDGKPTPDSKFVGLVLPASNNGMSHVMLLDNGMSAVLGKQYDWGHEEYDELTRGSDPKYFNPDMTKAQIFHELAYSPRNYGSGEYSHSGDVANLESLKNSIRDAMALAKHTVESRRKVRVDLANYTANLIDSTLSPKSP